MESSQAEEEPTTAQLQHKLQILEEEWSSMKQQRFPDPNPKTDRLRSRRSSSSAIINGQRVLELSPRSLMSSLQQPPMESRLLGGKLIKARRLFEDAPPDDSTGDGGGDRLDAASEVGSYGGDRRSFTVARVCVLVALMASFLGSLRRLCSFGFGEEMVLVPT